MKRTTSNYPNTSNVFQLIRAQYPLVPVTLTIIFLIGFNFTLVVLWTPVFSRPSWQDVEQSLPFSLDHC